MNLYLRGGKLSPSLKTERKMEEKILELLMGAKFERWYENDFMDYVEGEANSKCKEEILADLEKMLKSA